jgi:hypothetical protein
MYIYTYMYFFVDMFIFTIRTRLLHICYVRCRVHATNAIDDDNNHTEGCFMLETFALLNCFFSNRAELHVHSCHSFWLRESDLVTTQSGGDVFLYAFRKTCVQCYVSWSVVTHEHGSNIVRILFEHSSSTVLTGFEHD